MTLLAALLHLRCKPVHQTSETVTTLIFPALSYERFFFSFIATQSKGHSFLSFWVWIRVYCLHKDLYVHLKLSMLHIEFSESKTETVEEYNTCAMEKKGTQVKLLWRGTSVISDVTPFPAQQGTFEWQASHIGPNNQFFPPDLVIKCRPCW